MSARKDRVLGRGLSALIGGAEGLERAGEFAGSLGDREARLVEVERIGLNANQPRKIFKDKELKELADSIRQVGVLQPVLIRHIQDGEDPPLSLARRLDPDAADEGPAPAFCLVAGERRVRAARLAGVDVIPAIVCSYAEAEALKVALLENIQRENLNPVEEAQACQQLLDEYGATQDELAAMLGKSRSGVANTLRLLSLEPEILEMLQDEQLSRGHAKVLLGVSDAGQRVRLAKLCRSRGLSVRECEKRVQALLVGGDGAPARRRRTRRGVVPESPELRILRERTEEVAGTPVEIERDTQGRGTLALRFYSDDDLMRLLGLLGVDTDLS